jgi:phosphate-selective porin
LVSTVIDCTASPRWADSAPAAGGFVSADGKSISVTTTDPYIKTMEKAPTTAALVGDMQFQAQAPRHLQRGPGATGPEA